MMQRLGWIKRAWHCYTAWCDRMGLTEENRRCCMPKLSDPPLESSKPSDSVDSSNSPKQA